jgi:adenylosuccinate lyase
MRALEEGKPFKDLLAADADLGAVLSQEEIDHAFDLGVHLRHVDATFERVYREVRV